MRGPAAASGQRERDKMMKKEGGMLGISWEIHYDNLYICFSVSQSSSLSSFSIFLFNIQSFQFVHNRAICYFTTISKHQLGGQSPPVFSVFIWSGSLFEIKISNSVFSTQYSVKENFRENQN